MQKIKANFKAGLIDEGELLVFDNVLQSLCKIDPVTGEVKIQARYDGDEDYVVTWMFAMEKKVYLFTEEYPSMLTYDKMSMTFTKLDVPFTESEQKDNMVSKVFLYERKIWIMPLRITGHLWCYDLDEQRYELQDGLLEIIKQYQTNNLAIVYPTFFENEMWLALFGGTEYLKFNLMNNEVAVGYWESERIPLGCVKYDGQNLFVTQNSRNDISLVDKNGNTRVLSQGNQQDKAYSTIIGENRYFIALSRNANDVAIIDSVEMSVVRLHIQELTGLKVASNYLGKITQGIFGGDICYLFTNELHKLIELKYKENTYRAIELCCNFDYNAESVKRPYKNKECIKETKERNLEALIAYCKGIV